MECNLFDTYYPPVQMDTKSSILKIFERSGYTKVKSLSHVIHHYRKDNVDFGFIILRKSRNGFLIKSNRATHFVDKEKMDAFSTHQNVFVIVIEKSSGLTLVACLGKIIGHSGYNRNVEGTYFSRNDFMLFDTIVSRETRALDCELHESHEYAVPLNELPNW